MLIAKRLKLVFVALWTAGWSVCAVSCAPDKQPNAVASGNPSPVSSPKATIASTPTAEDKAVPRFDHIFVIIEENKNYNQIIGNPNAPAINQLAKTYGLASQYFGVVHPSEANYIAMLGGSTFGIHDDEAFYCRAGLVDRFCGDSRKPDYPNHTVASRSLIDQLEQKGLTWKGYFEDLPAPGSKVVVSPSVLARYAVKHNGFMNYKTVQDDPALPNKVVKLEQLTADLHSRNVPNYSHIIFNLCHEMHGQVGCSGLQQLIHTGDTYVGQVVDQITQSKLWSAAANSAIVITWDEDSNPEYKSGPQGCCGFDPSSAANFGGGHIATIVITNHGPRGVTDSTPYNHYSLLRTTEDAFGIYEYLNEANNTAQGVKPMTRLFAK